MDDETWYTAETALEKGFCDEVFKAGEIENRVQSVIIDSLISSEKHNEGGNEMDPKQLRALLGLPEAATDAQVTAKLTEVNVSSKSIRAELKLAETATDAEVIAALKTPEPTPTPAGTPEDLKAQMAALQAKMDTFVTGDMKTKAEALVKQGVKDLKVPPAIQDNMIKQAMVNFDAVKEQIDNMPVIIAATTPTPAVPQRVIDNAESLTAYYRSQETK